MDWMHLFVFFADRAGSCYYYNSLKLINVHQHFLFHIHFSVKGLLFTIYFCFNFCAESLFLWYQCAQSWVTAWVSHVNRSTRLPQSLKLSSLLRLRHYTMQICYLNDDVVAFFLNLQCWLGNQFWGSDLSDRLMLVKPVILTNK